MSLVIFCLLFSFVDYVPVKGEIYSFFILKKQFLILLILHGFILSSLSCLGHLLFFLIFIVIQLQLYAFSPQPLWKTVWNFLRKLKMELPFDPAVPLLGLYPKNPETPIQKNLCTPMFIVAQFTIAKCWK